MNIIIAIVVAVTCINPQLSTRIYRIIWIPVLSHGGVASFLLQYVWTKVYTVPIYTGTSLFGKQSPKTGKRRYSKSSSYKIILNKLA
jgi:hypothetical protein